MFADILSEQDRLLSQVDFSEMTNVWNEKVSYYHQKFPDSKKLFRYKTVTQLKEFSKAIIHAISKTQTLINCDFDAKRLKQHFKDNTSKVQILDAAKPVDWALKRKFVNIQSALICPKCGYDLSNVQQANDFQSTHNCDKKQKSGYKFPTKEQQYAWYNDPNIQVCAACRNIYRQKINGKFQYKNSHSHTGICPVFDRNATDLERNAQRVAQVEAKRVFKELQKQESLKAADNKHVQKAPSQITSRPIAKAVSKTNKKGNAISKNSKSSTVGNLPILFSAPSVSNKRNPFDPETGKGRKSVNGVATAIYQELLDVDGDGHCGYRALALVLNQRDNNGKHSYASLRVAALDHLRKYSQVLMDGFIQTNSSAGDSKTIMNRLVTKTSYLNSPAAAQYWFEAAHHAQIFADLLSVPICVTFDSYFAFGSTTYLPIHNFDSNQQPIFLHFNYNHYHVGIANDDKCGMPTPLECQLWSSMKAFKSAKDHFCDRFRAYDEIFKPNLSSTAIAPSIQSSAFKFPDYCFVPEAGLNDYLVPELFKTMYEKLVDVAGDGHCGFRALAYQLNRLNSSLTSSYGSIRINAINLLVSHQSAPYANNHIAKSTPKDLMERLRFFDSPVKNSQFWMADDLLPLLAEVLGAPICITDEDQLSMSNTYFPFSKFEPSNEPLFIHYSKSSFHYRAGIPKANCPMPTAFTHLAGDHLQEYMDYYSSRLEEYQKIYKIKKKYRQ